MTYALGLDLGTTYTAAAVWRDDSVCAPPAGPTRARLIFDADWTERREGVLAPGGELTIVYAQTRLDQCKQT